ncbi:hypothetical protein IMX12_13130 [Streptomyces sp. Babs14]|uniref:hypothetical protein n=1 Tax=unclassified Streptomyces TaxID=2593676 RepID=UPI001C22EA5F|nr:MULTISPECIES: hypothetical protein [unclassified Streptomyces]MBU8549752.1 hypothetical protein [Streptomyces sp. Osf17]MBU8556535.1 hypothetical protein [Streptomyces sp. Babs14]
MTVHLEHANLTDGVPVMHRVLGDVVQAAYDPDQVGEAAALAWLCIAVPRLVRDGFTVTHAVP